MRNSFHTQRLPDEAVLFGRDLAGEPLARNPKFPKYSEVRKLLGILPHRTKAEVRALLDARYLEAGTKDRPVSWKMPDQWIDKRLSGSEAEIALCIWNGSQKTVNPATIYGAYLLINRYKLLSVIDGIYSKNFSTSSFGKDRSSKTFEVDYFEGLFHIISWISVSGALERSKLQSFWLALCEQQSRMTSQRSMLTSLSPRISNLKARGFIWEGAGRLHLTKSGISYTEWLQVFRKEAA